MILLFCIDFSAGGLGYQAPLWLRQRSPSQHCWLVQSYSARYSAGSSRVSVRLSTLVAAMEYQQQKQGLVLATLYDQSAGGLEQSAPQYQVGSLHNRTRRAIKASKLATRYNLLPVYGDVVQAANGRIRLLRVELGSVSRVIEQIAIGKYGSITVVLRLRWIVVRLGPGYTLGVIYPC